MNKMVSCKPRFPLRLSNGLGRELAAALCCLCGGAAVAQTQQTATSLIEEALNLHLTICAEALVDFEGFEASLPSTLPDGTFGVRSSEDGAVQRIFISSGDGGFDTQVSRYAFANTLRTNCATYVADTSMHTPQLMSETYLDVVTRAATLGRVVGGSVPSLASGWGSGSDQLEEYEGSYEFLVTGLFEGQPYITISAVAEGYFSFVSAEPESLR